MHVSKLINIYYGIYGIKVGACIVDAGKKIVGIGHNKLPDGVDEEKFEFWENRDIEKDGFMKTKYPYGECMSLHLAVPHAWESCNNNRVCQYS